MLIIYTKKLKFIRMIKNYKINEKFIRHTVFFISKFYINYF